VIGFDVDVDTIVFTIEVVEVIALPVFALVVEGVVVDIEEFDVVIVVLLTEDNEIGFVAVVLVVEVVVEVVEVVAATGEATILVCKILVEIGLLETVTVDVLELIILDVVALIVEFASFFDIVIEEIGFGDEIVLA
jgi:hypothetical protein